MTADELQTTALAALESADVAVLKRLIVRMLPYVERDSARRKAQAERTQRSRDRRDVTSGNVTSVTPPSPALSPSFPPDPHNNPLPTPTPASPLAPHFADPDQRSAYERFRQAARSAVGFDATLRAVQSAMTGGAAYDWPVIGQALVELEGAGSKFSAEALRGFCRRLVQPRHGERPSRQDQNLAAIADGLRLYREVSPNGE